MDEDVAGDLNAPWHWGIVIQARVVFCRLVGASTEISSGCVVRPPGTDVGFQHDPVSLVCLELLFGKVNLDSLAFALSAGAGLSRSSSAKEGFEEIVSVLGRSGSGARNESSGHQ